MQHRTVRQGDEVYCSVCRLRWGADEDPPSEQCIPTVNRVEPPKYLREKLDIKKAERGRRVTTEQWTKLRQWADNGFKDGERPDGI